SNSTTTWSSSLYGMRDYSLQTSLDSVNWMTVDAVSGNTNSYTNRTLNTLAVGRFVRFFAGTGLTGNPNYEVSLLEFEVYGHYVSADLSSLVLSSGALVPNFTSSTVVYAQQVSFDTTSITVTPTAADSTATIKVNDVTVVSGQTSAPINLAVGNNTITVVVTPVYGNSKTYTVTVTRADSQYFSSLTLKSGTNTYNLVPIFSKAQGTYTATVPYDATTVTLTPVAEGSTSTITVNGTAVASGSASAPISMNVGVNPAITVECTLPSGVKQTYTVTVTRADSSYLSSLTVKSGPPGLKLVPNFASATLSYTVGAGSANTVSVFPVAQSTSASVTVNGTAITSTVKSVSVTLNGASTLAEIKVTNGGITTTYQVTITKP
ncbi:MAG: cadherin-like beta sandwich domain-containing protein, partial [Sphaerochaetaceae bacterium]